jgi:transposase
MHAYADGARAGAPEAVQVADRWHLWHNLGEAVERVVTRHHACLREPVADDEQAAAASAIVAAPVRESRLVVRTQQRYASVQERLAAGCSISQISRELDLERGTVYRFARAGSLDELLVKTTTRESQLDGFDPYLERRWTEGCMNANRLYSEIRAQGFSGGVQIVRRYVRRFRTTPAASAARPTQLKVRQVTTWIMQKPTSLEADEQESLQRVLDRCPELNALAGHVRAFAEMMRDLRGDRLVQWMDSVQADDLPDLHSFAMGVRRDQDAVVAGLTMRWSSGQVEGHVNRLKMLKRQMFGRAKFDLLRRRVLRTT